MATAEVAVPEGTSSRTRVVGAWWAPAVGLAGTGIVVAAEAERTAAHREVFWNDVPGWIVYSLFAALVGLLVYGFVRHASLWMLGQPAPGLLRQVPERLQNMTRFGLRQDKLRRDRYVGIMHWCILSSIVVLTFVTAQVALDDDLQLHFLEGGYYLFYSFYGDLFGVIGIVG